MLVLITFWISLFYQSRKNKKEYKTTGKKWLFKDIIFGHSSFAGLSYIPFYVLIHTDFSQNIGILKAAFFSLLFVSIGVVRIHYFGNHSIKSRRISKRNVSRICFRKCKLNEKTYFSQ
jgi:hypothetical protein